MANIENRRIKRRIAKYALPAAAALLLCAVIAGSILLHKACAGRKNAGEAAPTEPASAVPAQTAASEVPSEIPVGTQQGGAATASPQEPDGATQVPQQTTEDRSLIMCVLKLSGGYVKGSCSVDYVNNTDSVMYAAYFSAQGFNVTNASVGGVPARFENSEGAFMLPFVRELQPGGSAELFFEFEGVAVSGLAIPAPAYDTAFDSVCFVTSERPLEFSCGEAQLQGGSGAYVYRLEAERVTAVRITF